MNTNLKPQTSNLVLSIFPGIDLLGRAFEEEGFCVVRGPDLVWGGDIREFHPPAGAFAGVIGGPPCQCFSSMGRCFKKSPSRQANMVPDFERVIAEALPDWFIMENVPAAPAPAVSGYTITDARFNNRDLGEAQARDRRFVFGCARNFSEREFRAAISKQFMPENAAYHKCVMASGGYPPGYGEKRGRTELRKHGWQSWAKLADSCELQGLPRDFVKRDGIFTLKGAWRLVGNGVPIPMGRAVARAVRQIIYPVDPVDPV